MVDSQQNRAELPFARKLVRNHSWYVSENFVSRRTLIAALKLFSRYPRDVSTSVHGNTHCFYFSSNMASSATSQNISPNIVQAPKEIETRLFINGEFVPSKSGKNFDVVNPATEQISASVYEAELDDVNAAVAAAKAAFPPWSERGGFDRASFLYKLADLYETNNDELAKLEAISMGKPVGKYSQYLRIHLQHLF